MDPIFRLLEHLELMWVVRLLVTVACPQRFKQLALLVRKAILAWEQVTAASLVSCRPIDTSAVSAQLVSDALMLGILHQRLTVLPHDTLALATIDSTPECVWKSKGAVR